MGIPGFFDLARTVGAIEEADLPRDRGAQGRILAAKCLENGIKFIFVDVSSITGNVLMRTIKDYEATDFQGFARRQMLIDLSCANELHSLLRPVHEALPDVRIILAFDHPRWRPRVKEAEATKREEERLRLVLQEVLAHAARIRSGGKKHRDRADRHLRRAGLVSTAGDSPEPDPLPSIRGFRRPTAESLASLTTPAAAWLAENVILTTAPADADGLIAKAARMVTTSSSASHNASCGDASFAQLVGILSPPDLLSHLSSLAAVGSEVLVVSNDSDLAFNTGSVAAQYFARLQPVKSKMLLGWIDKAVLEPGLGVTGDGVGLANRAMALGQDFVEGRGVHGLGPAKLVAAGPWTRKLLDTDWIALDETGVNLAQEGWTRCRLHVQEEVKVVVPEKPWTAALRAFRGDDAHVFDKSDLSDAIWRTLIADYRANCTPPHEPAASSPPNTLTPLPQPSQPARAASTAARSTDKATLHNLRLPAGTEFATPRRPRQRPSPRATSQPALVVDSAVAAPRPAADSRMRTAPDGTGQARRRQAKASAKHATMVQVRQRGHVEPSWSQLARLRPAVTSTSSRTSGSPALASCTSTTTAPSAAASTSTTVAPPPPSAPGTSLSAPSAPSSSAGASKPVNGRRKATKKKPTLAELRKDAKRRTDAEREDEADDGGSDEGQVKTKSLMALRRTVPIRTRDLNMRLSSSSPAVFRFLQLLHAVFNSFIPHLIVTLANDMQTLRARHSPLSSAFLRLVSDPAEASKAVVKAIKLMLDLVTGQKGGPSAQSTVWALMGEEIGLAPASETQQLWEEEWRDVEASVRAQLLERSIPLGDYLAVLQARAIFPLSTALAGFLRHAASLAILEDIAVIYCTSQFNIRQTRLRKFVKAVGEAFLTAPSAAVLQLYTYMHKIRLSLVYLVDTHTDVPSAPGYPALPPLLPIPSFPFIAAPDLSVLENLSAAAVSSPPLFNAIASLLPSILGRVTAHTPLSPEAVLDAIQILKPRLRQLCDAAEPAVMVEDVAFLVVCLGRMMSHLLLLAALSEATVAELKVNKPKTSGSSGTGTAWLDARHSRIIGSSSLEAPVKLSSSDWSGSERDRRAMAILEAVQDVKTWKTRSPGNVPHDAKEEEEDQSRLAQVLPRARGSIDNIMLGDARTTILGSTLVAALEQIVELVHVSPTARSSPTSTLGSFASSSASALTLALSGVTRALFSPTHLPASVADICSLLFIFMTKREHSPEQIVAATATVLSQARPHLVAQAPADRAGAVAGGLDDASAALASIPMSEIVGGSALEHVVERMRELWGASSSSAQIHRLATGDQLEAFKVIFGNARLGHLPHGAISFTQKRLHVKVLRLDLTPAHVVRQVVEAAAASSSAQAKTLSPGDPPIVTPPPLPSLSVSGLLSLASQGSHANALYAGLSLPPERVPDDAAATVVSGWFDEQGDLLSTTIGRRRLAYPPFISEPPIPSLPTLPLLHAKSSLLQTLRQKIGLEPDGTGDIAEGILFLFIDLGIKNPVTMWIECIGNRASTKAVILRDATFLEAQRRDARDGRTRTAFDLKRRRDQLHARATQQLITAAGLAPAKAASPPLDLSATPASSSTPAAATSTSASSVHPTPAPPPPRQTVVISIGAGAIESSSGQRGPRAAGPVACEFVEQLSGRDDLDVLAFAIDDSFTSSRCVCLDCRLKADMPLVKFEWADGKLAGRPFQRIVVCSLCGLILNRDETGAQNIGLNALAVLKFGTTTFSPVFRERFGFPWTEYRKKAAGRRRGKARAKKEEEKGAEDGEEEGKADGDEWRPQKRRRTAQS